MVSRSGPGGPGLVPGIREEVATRPRVGWASDLAPAVLGPGDLQLEQRRGGRLALAQGGQALAEDGLGLGHPPLLVVEAVNPREPNQEERSRPHIRVHRPSRGTPPVTPDSDSSESQWPS